MVTKELDQYTVDCNLLLKNVTVEDAGKYKVTARNDLGESNATISLNFDSKTLYPFSLKYLYTYSPTSEICIGKFETCEEIFFLEGLSQKINVLLTSLIHNLNPR